MYRIIFLLKPWVLAWPAMKDKRRILFTAPKVSQEMFDGCHSKHFITVYLKSMATQVLDTKKCIHHFGLCQTTVHRKACKHGICPYITNTKSKHLNNSYIKITYGAKANHVIERRMQRAFSGLDGNNMTSGWWCRQAVPLKSP